MNRFWFKVPRYGLNRRVKHNNARRRLYRWRSRRHRISYHI